MDIHNYKKKFLKENIVIHKKGIEADFLEACADKVIVYENFEDLREKLKKVFITVHKQSF